MLGSIRRTRSLAAAARNAPKRCQVGIRLPPPLGMLPTPCARKRASMELRDWVYGDALYDQIPFAIYCGLASHLAQRPIITWFYLRFVFFAAMDSLEERGLAVLEKKGNKYACVLTEEGRKLAEKYEAERMATYPKV